LSTYHKVALHVETANPNIDGKMYIITYITDINGCVAPAYWQRAFGKIVDFYNMRLKKFPWDALGRRAQEEKHFSKGLNTPSNFYLHSA